ncbi:MAG: YigZ family protein [Oscillospiraceae bacterium]
MDVLCVVTRYFGGILLGAGGLCRAYTKAAKDALDAGVNFQNAASGSGSKLPFPTRFLSRAKLLIAAQEGTVEDAQYGADILMTYRIPEGADERLRTALREASSGSVVPSLLEEIFCAG